MNLRGKTVLITGASSGIGHATARALAAEGAVLAISGRNEHALDDLARIIAAQGGQRPIVLTADLAVRGEAESLAARAIAALGSIDILVNNAAAEGTGTYTTAGDGDDSRTLFEINYWSPFALNRALLPAMLQQGGGAVVNVSSLGAITPVAGTGHYASSKAALAIATEALRAELRSSGVHVMLVYPGFVDTPMLRAFTQRLNLTPRMRRALSLMPIGQAEGLARAIVRALRRKRSIVVYPRSYAVTPWMPALSRRFTNLLFGTSSAATVGSESRRCCRPAALRRTMSWFVGRPLSPDQPVR